jgi:hypothetical protein
MPTLTRGFPCLASVLKSDADRVELVSHTIVGEVLRDLGTLDFGKGMAAKFNVAIWRERGMHRPLAGEFASVCRSLRLRSTRAGHELQSLCSRIGRVKPDKKYSRSRATSGVIRAGASSCPFVRLSG